MKRAILCALSLSLGVSCSLPQRSQQSGYDRSGEKVSAETPVSNLDQDQQRALDQKMRLRAMESRLQSRQEREQYSKALPWLKNDEEKIELLSQPNLEARQIWLQDKGLWKRSRSVTPEMKELIETGDITLGMPMDYVRKAWGEPQAVEVSGNPIFKNERWKYVRQVSSPDGYKQERRLVYFEGGKVVGWETE